MPRKIPKEIASADDDVISGILLEWSGLSERWQRHELDAICDFTRDVAEHCKHIEIETENWDGGMPGRSGVWHKVTTDDVRILKKEMTDRVTELIRTNRAKTARIKAERQSNKLKELRGPKTSRLLFEVDIWDDLSPTTYVFHIEQPNSISADYCFWEKKSVGWELQPISSSQSLGLAVAVESFLLWYLGPTIGKDVLSFRPGPDLQAKELKLILRRYSAVA